MKIAENGINLIKLSEGCSSKVKNKNIILNEQDIKNNILVYPYYCSANHLTIGWGNRIKDDKGNWIYGESFENGLKVEECLKMFISSLKQYEDMIIRWLKVKINQNQFDALVCFCYNIPKGAKSIIEIINDNGNSILIQKTWLKYCKIGNIESQGLLKRRKKELELFNKI
jgi:lysozyme